MIRQGEASSPELVVTVRPDGPLIAEGPVVIREGGGGEHRGTNCALCRCGASANKPFCDGAHVAAGFSDAKAEDRTPDTVKDYAGKQIGVVLVGPGEIEGGADGAGRTSLPARVSRRSAGCGSAAVSLVVDPQPRCPPSSPTKIRRALPQDLDR